MIYIEEIYNLLDKKEEIQENEDNIDALVNEIKDMQEKLNESVEKVNA
ncbi:MAG: hypothetical protein KID00_13895 [Clostridium argentinense]|uniref:Uncharacterized protein n=1 Tax=Clostridium faecium TaxID=2762223 RepID=A0ABR8YQ48_9CLOT|nr:MULTISPECIES: hypothetical protein [Clostridium]MBD8046375.1 hypothetical protein [Clostridium faecium]MBS5824917.1 hypothetical protein [Clostridium argentinense]MDU1349372.1 hypothetical protein [Clostridium argentinense]